MILEADNVPIDMRGERISVVLLDMDTGIPEQINSNSDGSYTIFLNARHSYSTQHNCFVHAIRHIRRNDWEGTCVQEIETEAHEKAVPTEMNWGGSDL